jgi:hypothetical protein
MINIGVKVYLLYPDFCSFVYMPRAVSLDHMALLFLDFKGISILLSK